MLFRIHKFFIKLTSIKLILLFILICILSSFLYSLLLSLLDVPSIPKNINNVENIYVYFIKIVIFAPLIETILFQFIPVEFIKLWKIRNIYIVIFLGLVFGVLHFFNNFLLREFFFTFYLGSLFTYIYLITTNKGRLSALLSLTLIHSGYNLFVFLIKTNFT